MGREPAAAPRRRQQRPPEYRGSRQRVAAGAGRPAAGGRSVVGGPHVPGVEGAMAGVKARPRLLFLCQTLPYPPDGGVWIRTYNVLRLLAHVFDITALCFERSGTADTGTDRDVSAIRNTLSPLAALEVFPLPQQHSRLRFFWDHARSVVWRRVYTTFLYESSAFRRRLDDLLRTSTFDLVHMDSLDLARYLPACGDLPVVCVHHDVESDLLRRRAGVERDWRKRAYLGFQSGLMG